MIQESNFQSDGPFLVPFCQDGPIFRQKTPCTKSHRLNNLSARDITRHIVFDIEKASYIQAERYSKSPKYAPSTNPSQSIAANAQCATQAQSPPKLLNMSIDPGPADRDPPRYRIPHRLGHARRPATDNQHPPALGSLVNGALDDGCHVRSRVANVRGSKTRDIGCAPGPPDDGRSNLLFHVLGIIASPSKWCFVVVGVWD